MTAPLEWTIVVPLKALPAAKSRLTVGLDARQHANLVEAIRTDTLAAVTPLGRVLVIWDRPPDTEPAYLPPPAQRLVQSGTGLNAALREAAVIAAERWPATAVVALVGDLPALRTDELEQVLELAAQYSRSFVIDMANSGTTLLAALPGTELAPGFGVGSAARHGRIAQSLPAGPGLRLDVDTAADLQAAVALGVGPATRTALPE